MLNHITLQARLVRDPELRRLPSGKSVVNVSVACDRDFTKDGGEKETDFIDIVAFGGTADHLAKWFTKGKMIIVSGRLQIRTWSDKDGNKRRNAEVLADSVYFGDSKKSDQGNSTYQTQDPYQTQGPYQGYGSGSSEAMAMVAQYEAKMAQQSDFVMLEDDDVQLPF